MDASYLASRIAGLSTGYALMRITLEAALAGSTGRGTIEIESAAWVRVRITGAADAGTVGG